MSAAAAVGQSLTLIPNSRQALPRSFKERITAIFAAIGENVICSVSSALVTSRALQSCVPVVMTMILEAMIDAAVSRGIARGTADTMIRHLMRSTFHLMDKTTPFALREKLALPGECAIAGVIALEEVGLRGAITHGLGTAIDVEKSLERAKP